MILNDVFPAWMIGKGVFQLVGKSVDFPWHVDETITDKGLDFDYHGNHSGKKTASPLLEVLAENNVVSQDDVSVLAEVIKSEYLKRWSKLWDTLTFQYNPIENYAMVEEGTDTTVGEDSGETSNTTTYGKTENHTNTSNSTTSYGRTEERTENATESAKNALYGFNSADPTDDSSRDVEGNTTANTEAGGKDSTEGNDTDTMTSGGKDANSTTSKNDSKSTLTHRLTRSGNIGVTTSQQMLQSERDVWKYEYFQDVFADVDKILVLNIYEREGL